MSLFSDGPPSNIEDLTDQDSGLLEICRVQQIDASVKLRLAHSVLARDVESLFEEQRSVYSSCSLNASLSLNNVAITPTLKMWHTWQALSLVYRDAYFNQGNERMAAKWNEYRRLADEEKTRLREVGIGIVWDPLTKPEAPSLAPVPAAEVGGTFYLSITLINAAGEQSAASPVQSIQLSDGNAIDVQLASTPPNANGWNAYVGSRPEALYLQNTTPISTDSHWLFYPSVAVLSGASPERGQCPNTLKALPRLLRRG